MLDRHLRHCLLAVIGFAGMATAAGTGDLRLPEAARNQDAKAVRSLLSSKGRRQCAIQRRLDGAALAGALERC